MTIRKAVASDIDDVARSYEALFDYFDSHRDRTHGSLTPASEKKCHEASKMAYFFVKFYKFVSAISYYM